MGNYKINPFTGLLDLTGNGVSVFIPDPVADDTASFNAYIAEQEAKGLPIFVYSPSQPLKLTDFVVSDKIIYAARHFEVEFNGTLNSLTRTRFLGFDLHLNHQSVVNIMEGYHIWNNVELENGGGGNRTQLIITNAFFHARDYSTLNGNNRCDLYLIGSRVELASVSQTVTGSLANTCRTIIGTNSVLHVDKGFGNVVVGANLSLVAQDGAEFYATTFHTLTGRIWHYGSNSKTTVHAVTTSETLTVEVLASGSNYLLDVPDISTTTISASATKKYIYEQNSYTSEGAFIERNEDGSTIRQSSAGTILSPLDELNYWATLVPALERKRDASNSNFITSITDNFGRLFTPSTGGFMGASLEIDEVTAVAKYNTTNAGSITRTGNVATAPAGYHGVARYRLNSGVGNTRYNMLLPGLDLTSSTPFFYEFSTLMANFTNFVVGADEWTTVWALGNNSNAAGNPTIGCFFVVNPAINPANPYRIYVVTNAAVSATPISTGIDMPFRTYRWFGARLYAGRLTMFVRDLEYNTLFETTINLSPSVFGAIVPYFKIVRTITTAAPAIDLHVIKSVQHYYLQK